MSERNQSILVSLERTIKLSFSLDNTDNKSKTFIIYRLATGVWRERKQPVE